MQASELPNLHDAVLRSISVDWEDASATLQVTLVGGERDQEDVAIRGVGLVRLSVPREQPWGASVFVNGSQLSPVGDHLTLSIEMQSGDLIEMVAASIESS